DAPAENDFFRREHQDGSGYSLADVERLNLPCRMVRSQLASFDLPPLFQCRTRCHPFKAISMVGTDPFERILRMASRQNMSAFRMHQAVNKPAFRINARADPGADGIVNAAVETLGRSP